MPARIFARQCFAQERLQKGWQFRGRGVDPVGGLRGPWEGVLAPWEGLRVPWEGVNLGERSC